jgi:hypothetical protein
MAEMRWACERRRVNFRGDGRDEMALREKDRIGINPRCAEDTLFAIGTKFHACNEFHAVHYFLDAYLVQVIKYWLIYANCG